MRSGPASGGGWESVHRTTFATLAEQNRCQVGPTILLDRPRPGSPTPPPSDFPVGRGPRRRRSVLRTRVADACAEAGAYVLKAGNEKYLPDSQKKAKNYKGKDVKIMGTLDKTRNLIHVEKIEASPSI
jgi:hypothetical protein